MINLIAFKQQIKVGMKVSMYHPGDTSPFLTGYVGEIDFDRFYIWQNMKDGAKGKLDPKDKGYLYSYSILFNWDEMVEVVGEVQRFRIKDIDISNYLHETVRIYRYSGAFDAEGMVGEILKQGEHYYFYLWNNTKEGGAGNIKPATKGYKHSYCYSTKDGGLIELVKESNNRKYLIKDVNISHYLNKKVRISKCGKTFLEGTVGEINNESFYLWHNNGIKAGIKGDINPVGYEYSMSFSTKSESFDIELLEEYQIGKMMQSKEFQIGGSMLNCIAKAFAKTEDALLVEKHQARLLGNIQDTVLMNTLVTQNRDIILAEAKKMEEEINKVK